ncbi:unnamed protein product [Closterium sp. NIES-54]
MQYAHSARQHGSGGAAWQGRTAQCGQQQQLSSRSSVCRACAGGAGQRVGCVGRARAARAVGEACGRRQQRAGSAQAGRAVRGQGATGADSAQWHGDAEYNGPAEQAAPAPTVGRKRGGAKPHKTSSTKGKAPAKESARSKATVEASPGKGPSSDWSLKESTILVAARWFTKDELYQMTGKPGSQYWLRLIEHIKLQHPDWSRNVTACSNRGKRLNALWKQIDKGDTASGGATVIKPPWWSWMVLSYEDTAAAAPHALDGGGGQDVSVDPGLQVPKASIKEPSPSIGRGTPPSARRRINETATMAAAQLLADTFKQYSSDGVAQITGVIREWMARQ